MDILSIIGVIIGFATIIGANVLEGGTWQSLINGPAALIVIGGTLGAAILQTPKQHLRRALYLFTWVYKPPLIQHDQGIHKIVGWANAVRRDGLLGLEHSSEKEKDLFARKGLQMLVDGQEPEVIRHVLETDLVLTEKRDLEAVNFYESMGGYAPTIGILGAVIGLIHVMQHLNDPAQLGPGIAVAFVATIYGVAFANLLLLPVAHKLRLNVKEISHYRELIIEGLLAISNGENPKAIQIKLNGFLYPNNYKL